MFLVACSASGVQGYMKAAESSDEDMVAALSSIYSNRAIGKELQMDVDSHGPAQASMQEVRAHAASPAQQGTVGDACQWLQLGPFIARVVDDDIGSECCGWSGYASYGFGTP